MILATTTEDFSRFTVSHEERIRYIYEAGFRYVDLSLYHVGEGDPLFGKDWREAAESLLAYAEGLGMRFVQCHAPAVNCLAAPERAIALTERAIEVCGILGIPTVVTHAGYDATADEDTWREGNLRFYRALMPTAEACGVRVLAENSAHANIKGYFLYAGKDMRAFADAMAHKNFGICWYTSHANMEVAQYDVILAIGVALGAIHFHDNRGERDEHLLPFLGTMNVDEVVHALLDVGFRGPFTFEATSSLRPARFWQGNRREFAADTRMAEPTLPMQQAIERALYVIGCEILHAYGLFEE
jgi:sugar phosphate isomerase/epimerase